MLCARLWLLFEAAIGRPHKCTVLDALHHLSLRDGLPIKHIGHDCWASDDGDVCLLPLALVELLVAVARVRLGCGHGDRCGEQRENCLHGI